jgi:hypothetical protein
MTGERGGTGLLLAAAVIVDDDDGGGGTGGNKVDRCLSDDVQQLNPALS